MSDSPDEFRESPYFVSIFGEPASGEPWAWQIDSHHLCVNCTVIGDQMVLTPTFMGSEPCHVDERAAGRHRSERIAKKVRGLIDYATTYRANQAERLPTSKAKEKRQGCPTSNT